jgi:hypothetical protein
VTENVVIWNVGCCFFQSLFPRMVLKTKRREVLRWWEWGNDCLACLFFGGNLGTKYTTHKEWEQWSAMGCAIMKRIRGLGCVMYASFLCISTGVNSERKRSIWKLTGVQL